MIFNSPQFALFVLFILFVYYCIPNKWRNIFLLVCSYCFYWTYIPKYVPLILVSTIFSFFAAKLIDKSEHKRNRKLILISFIIVILVILFFFKYYNFFIDNINYMNRLFGIENQIRKSSLLVPVGISFYTFSILSYVIDVYNRKIASESNFFDYALYVIFFPKLVCGPIESASKLLPQFKEEHIFDYNSAIAGGKKVIYGLFKKVAIADILGIFVDALWRDIYSYEGLLLLLGVIFYSIQIYCDFSGYSDIAIGIAEMLGFRFEENFRAPYMAKSLKEFWNRWHISLNTWLRDYIYFPLGGGRKGAVRKYCNVFIVFLVSGIWHGANITFIIWGVVHGLLRIIEELFISKNNESKVKAIIGKIYTYVIVTMVWVLFRADSIHSAVYVYSNMFKNIAFNQSIWWDVHVLIQNALFDSNFLVITYVGWTLISVLYLMNNDLKNRKKRSMEYYVMTIAIVFWYILQNGVWGQTGNFIYFNF